jgi:hypothetical protein
MRGGGVGVPLMTNANEVSNFTRGAVVLSTMGANMLIFKVRVFYSQYIN